MKTVTTENFSAQALVITCEHGGNHIPEAYQDLFQDQGLLDSHRGFDAGALSMAKDLAIAFAAPLVSATISRLLVDLNRSVGNRSLHAKVIQGLPKDKREQILQQYYLPYRTQAEETIRQTIAEHGKVLHISSHSFTPVLGGKERRADIGLLYDPIRAGEIKLCQHWQADLKAYQPQLIVRRNYPYAGKGDGLTSRLRQQLSPTIYMGIELEINQKHIFNAGQQWKNLRKVIVESLARVLAKEIKL